MAHVFNLIHVGKVVGIQAYDMLGETSGDLNVILASPRRNLNNLRNALHRSKPCVKSCPTFNIKLKPLSVPNL